MELIQFDIQYVSGISIEGQVLVDFMVECNETEAATDLPDPVIPTWRVYIDGALNENRSGARIAMKSLEGLKLQVALRFKFLAYNNEAEYEALLAGLRLAKVVGAHKVEVFSDSQLVFNQVLGEYQTRGEKMDAYVSVAREFLKNSRAIKLNKFLEKRMLMRTA
uniref:RNase H type-1 domain-containing protein n=1 Tax=Cannabis sativa TaxID=3483 RepID=A0A803Q0M4_CANSA